MPENSNSDRVHARGAILANAAIEMTAGDADVGARVMSESVVALVIAIAEIASHTTEPPGVVRRAIDLLANADVRSHRDHCPACKAARERAREESAS